MWNGHRVNIITAGRLIYVVLKDSPGQCRRPKQRNKDYNLNYVTSSAV